MYRTVPDNVSTSNCVDVSMKPTKVYLPPESNDECCACGSKGSGRKTFWCSRCGEALYCSKECQKNDWPTHKAHCGTTECIELKSFYPFLALLFELGVADDDRPIPPALTHKIVNKPDATMAPSELPNGSTAKVVSYGEDFKFQPGSSQWWPTSPTPKSHYKLFHRIYRDGHNLPNYFAICLALLAKIYTTTSVSAAKSPSGRAQQRLRLTIYSTRLADFGIIKGRVQVSPANRLAFHNANDDTYTYGQDPDDHYWLYFKNVRGEEYCLDCSMYPFDYTQVVVNTTPYTRVVQDFEMPALPAVWIGKASQTLPQIRTEERRLSFLRDCRVTDIIERIGLDFEERNFAAVSLLMNELAGKTVDVEDKCYAFRITADNCYMMDQLIEKKSWTSWPEQPRTVFQLDPRGGEVVAPQTEEEAAYFSRLVKQFIRGDLTEEKMHNRYNAFVKSRRS